MFVETLLCGAIVTLLTQIVKRWIKPKFGSNGVLIFVVFASIVYGAFQYWSSFWSVETLQAITQTVAYAIAIYEILISKINNALETHK